MVSQTAIESLRELESKGLKPSFEDVIRLNALGLRLEAYKRKRAVDSTYCLPRVAVISDKVSFRQPTVGHDVWFDRIERLVRDDDFDTVLAIKAFGLSRPWEDLPDPDDPRSVKTAIGTFVSEMAGFTKDQIYAAVRYAIDGADPSDGEYPARPAGREPDGTVPEDWDESVSVGVLNEGRVALWGATVADIKSMTVRQLRDLIRRAYVYHDMTDSAEDKLEGGYYATVDEIEARLMAEKGS